MVQAPDLGALMRSQMLCHVCPKGHPYIQQVVGTWGPTQEIKAVVHHTQDAEASVVQPSDPNFLDHCASSRPAAYIEKHTSSYSTYLYLWILTMPC